MEKNQLLVESGHEIATHMLQSAVESATTPEQAINQITVLYYASCHMLGACAFNWEKDKQMSVEEFLTGVHRRIRLEVVEFKKEFLRGGLDLLGYGSSPPPETL